MAYLNPAFVDVLGPQDIADGAVEYPVLVDGLPLRFVAVTADAAGAHTVSVNTDAAAMTLAGTQTLAIDLKDLKPEQSRYRVASIWLTAAADGTSFRVEGLI